MITLHMSDDHFIFLIQQLKENIENTTGLDKMALQLIYNKLMEGVFTNENQNVG